MYGIESGVFHRVCSVSCFSVYCMLRLVEFVFQHVILVDSLDIPSALLGDVFQF